MSAPEPIARTPKAAELVAAAIRARIVTGELREDALLPPEAVLLQEFGVSRPTLREAYRILESESLVRVLRGAQGGARIQVPDGDVAARYAGYVLQYRGATMADVYLARAELEAPFARLPAQSATPAKVAQLEAALAAAEPHVGNPETYIAHDVEFHWLVVELAGSETLNFLVDMVLRIIATAHRRYVEEVNAVDLLDGYRQVHRTHVKLVGLARAGDAVAA